MVVPLCVDLDGTLILSDLLWETFARLVKMRPLAALLAPICLFRGRAALKRQLAKRVTLDVANLPYNEPLLAYLRAERLGGRRLVLVTASDQTLAVAVAAHVGLFDEVLGSDGAVNLRSEAKSAMLVAHFGEQGFDYAGDSAADAPVWAHARSAILVGASDSVARVARTVSTVRSEFSGSGGRARALCRILRPHQWVKNLIVFVPLLTSHQLTHPAALWLDMQAFVAFCLCASAVYVLNDLLDLDADRHHPTKRLRPLAMGALPLAWAFWLGPLLMAGGFAVSAMVTAPFACVLGLYVAVAFAYSWRLKQAPLVDVFTLAGLYTLRLIAGHAATGVEYSDWLLAFSMFIFLSLALVKRFRELKALGGGTNEVVKGRGYIAEDLPLLAPLGVASGYLAVLVLALYVTSEKVRLLYHRPTLLLLTCPLFLYWISRMWLAAQRGRMNDDPITFALKDRQSYLIGGVALFVVWLAT